ARTSEIGYLPYAEDIETEGLDISSETMNDLLSVDKATWLEDVENIKKFYAEIGDTIPASFKTKLAVLEERLSK
ncbi:MAG: phosphoenolpyruvate carboxykinase (GTP), partial [Clostridia bacterium]|nr:phosphoenolpyruvate carboxykinase (GTP) [Clostridia bacterium]